MILPKSTFWSLGLAVASGIVIPLAVLVWARWKYRISLKVVVVGALVWLVFTQILEKALHAAVMQTALFRHPAWFALYGILIAGLFEEVGRWLAFTFALKRRRGWVDAIAYGIGHGGVEMVFLTVSVAVPLLVFATMINAGTFGSAMAERLPAAVVSQIQNILLMPSHTFILGIIERLCAFGLQIALSVLVLYGILRKRWYLLAVAIGMHAVIDLPAALYQARTVSLWVTELIVAVLCVLALWYIRWMKPKFAEPLALEL